MQLHPSRRTVVASLVAATSLPLLSRPVSALPSMVVHRDPGCGCCEGWVAHVRAAGFDARVVDEADMNAIKAKFRIPEALASCHTAEIGGYVIEGHVPASAIQKLLREKPVAIGLSAPGMPDGSPGMETGGPKEVFEVVLFAPSGSRSFGRYQGASAI